MPRTLGIVLAGGRGGRLGLGIPKALVALCGVSLLDCEMAWGCQAGIKPPT